MSFTIRPFAADFAGVATLLNSINPEPISPEQLEAIHGRFPADGIRYRAVAVAGDGAVVGYANTTWVPGAKPGQFYFTLVTRPETRGQGVGSALLAHLEGWVKEQGGTAVMTGAPDDDETAAQFAQKRGFAVDGHQWTSFLDVPTFDETPFADVVERVRESGIRFFTYAEQPGDESLQKLYELYKVTDLDTPGFAGLDPAAYKPYADWYAEVFGDGLVLEDGLFIAADGDRFVGMTLLQKDGAERQLYTEYTGVLREYRGRQIGLALKLLSIRFAKAYGAPSMRTANDGRNKPMLAINRKTGYRKTSGRYWFLKAL